MDQAIRKARITGAGGLFGRVGTQLNQLWGRDAVVRSAHEFSEGLQPRIPDPPAKCEVLGSEPQMLIAEGLPRALHHSRVADGTHPREIGFRR